MLLLPKRPKNDDEASLLRDRGGGWTDVVVVVVVVAVLPRLGLVLRVLRAVPLLPILVAVNRDDGGGILLLVAVFERP